MKLMNRLATLPYVSVIIICVFIFLPFALYNIFTVYKSHSELINTMEKDFNGYLKWVLIKDRSFMAEFFSYRLNSVHRNIDKKLQSSLKVAQSVAEAVYKDLPELEASERFSKCSFTLPVYIMSKDRKLIAGSNDLLHLHKDFLAAGSADKAEKNNYLILEAKLKKQGFIIGTLIEKAEIKNLYRKDVLAFSRHREDSGIFNFILERDGRFVHNESRLFPGRRIADPEEQEKAKLLIQKFIQSTNKENEEVVHFSWKIPGMPSQPPQAKMAFTRYEADLDWIIGSSIDSREFEEYYAESQKYLEEKLHRDLIGLILPFSLVFFAMLLIGRIITGKALKGLSIFKNYFVKARKANEVIRYDNLPFEEFKELAVVANKMVKDRKRQKNIILAYTKKIRLSNKKLRKIANRDGLTGVANRRFFNNAMNKSWLNELRQKKPITIVMIDIDFFKQYNDIYGHQMGDKCLIRVAACIKHSINRPFDRVARYGGEEFIVMLPGTDSEGGLAIARQLQNEIALRKIPHKGSAIDKYLTCSIGLATIIPKDKHSANELVEMADIALYHAKVQGRNRIVVHVPDMMMPV